MPAGGATRGTGATSRLGNRYHGQPWRSSNGFDGRASIRSLGKRATGGVRCRRLAARRGQVGRFTELARVGQRSTGVPPLREREVDADTVVANRVPADGPHHLAGSLQLVLRGIGIPSEVDA